MDLNHFFQDAIDDKLDVKHFPFLAGRVAPTNYGRPTPTRYAIHFCSGCFYFTLYVDCPLDFSFCYTVCMNYEIWHRTIIPNLQIVINFWTIFINQKSAFPSMQISGEHDNSKIQARGEKFSLWPFHINCRSVSTFYQIS